jgi:hypothetical protein
MHIQTFDQLLEYTSAVISGEREFEPVTLADSVLVVPVKVYGDSWDKRMDVRHAQYVTCLQKELNTLIGVLRPDIKAKDRPLVRVELREGSSELWQSMAEVGKHLVIGMTDKQKFTLGVLAILGICGTWNYTRYLDHLDTQSKVNAEVRQLEVREQTKLEILKPMLSAVEHDPEKYSQYERPVAKLLGMLKADDQVSLLGEDYVPAKIAKTTINPRAHTSSAYSIAPQKIYFVEDESRSRMLCSSEQVSFCDGEYTLLSTDYSHSELVLYLKKDGVSIKAYTSALNDATRRALLEEISRRQLEESLPFTLNLQMSVEHSDKEIKYGNIVGLGSPRGDKENKLLSVLVKK